MSALAPLPREPEAEKSVLGGILLCPEQVFDVADVLTPDDFAAVAHRAVYAAMLGLAQRSQPIDILTVLDELRASGTLADAGGPGYVGGLDAFVPSTSNLLIYAEQVKDASIRRGLCEAAARTGQEARDPEVSTGDALDRAQQRVFEVGDKRLLGKTEKFGDTVTRVFKTLEQRFESQSEVTGLATGLDDLDRMTAGLQKKDLVILAGRPSMGKTALVMNIAAHVAIDLNRPVVVFSLEMGADQLTTRLLASEGRVDSQRLRNGRLLDADWPKLARAADRLHKAKLTIDDTAGASLMHVRSKARGVAAKEGDLALVVVDYLQLMSGAGENREQAISTISRGLKALAKDLDVPVIALSQLSRAVEKREDKRPMMSDLRESGAIEQDADVIGFIYRDEVYDKDTADKGVAEIILGKQRNGPVGTVRCAFLNDFTRFENLARGVGW